MIEIIAPAIIIGLLIAITHGMLGLKILEKGIIFIDLAVAQIAGVGLIIADHIWPEQSLAAQTLALGFALASCIIFYYTEKIAPNLQEAIIGSSFVLASSLAMLLLANHAHGADEIKHLLSGQILFVTFKDLMLHAPIYILIIAIWFWQKQLRDHVGFYLIFAFAVTSSVQLVGVYVVFASLILPALAAYKHNNPMLRAWLYGALSVILGIILSVIFDLPTGPLLVLSYSLITCLVAIKSYFLNTLKRTI